MNSVIEATRKLDISSKLGYNFKVEGNVGTPERLTFEAACVGFSTDNIIEWLGSREFETWTHLGEGKEFVLSYNDFLAKDPINLTYYIKARVKDNENKEYESWITIMALVTGEKGEDALMLVITSSNGNFFRNDTGSTVLTARLFKGGQEIDAYAPYDYVYTWSDANDPSWAPETQGKTLAITADDVYFSRTYVCNISKGGN
jgi:hypothetical protein